MYQQAFSLFDTIGDHVNMTQPLGNLALLDQEEGNLEQALEYFEQALVGYQDIGDKRGEAIVLVNLARLYAQRGDAEQTAVFTSQAHALAEAFDFRDQLARLQDSSGKGVVKAAVEEKRV